MAAIGDHLRLAGSVLPNRIVRSATYEAMAAPDGSPTPALQELYTRLARGGVGLIITGIAAVSPAGRSLPAQIVLGDDGAVPAWQALNAAVLAHGALTAAQLSHGGRQVSPLCAPGPVPVAPSPSPASAFSRWARALSAAEIEATIEDFARAAARAQAAGFAAVQLNAAHGYLVSSFLSPLTNRRRDRWGGDEERRFRFLGEVYRAVRAAVGPEYPVLCKLNLLEFLPGGLDVEAGVRAARRLAALGVDAIEPSGGVHETLFFSARGDIPVQELLPGLAPWQRPLAGLVLRALRPRCRFREAFFLDLVRRLKPALGCPVFVVGGLRTPARMRTFVAAGLADAVALSRPLIREPAFARTLVAGSERASACTACNRCIAAASAARPLRCRAPAGDRPPARGGAVRASVPPQQEEPRQTTKSAGEE